MRLRSALTARASDRTFVVVLVVAAFVLRVFALGRDDFWSDEVHTFDAIALAPIELIRERLASGHLPLYFLLEKAWATVAGNGEFALRLPSALLGALAVIPAWAVFLRLLRGSGDAPHQPAERQANDAARWATGGIAFHPLLVELSREARMYPLLLVAFVVLVHGMLRVIDGERAPVWLWAAAIVGGLTHPTWAFAVVPATAWFVLEVRRAQAGGAASASGVQSGARRAVLIACGLSLALLGLTLLGSTVQQPELTRRPWLREAGVYTLRQVAGSGIRDRYLLLYVATFVATLGVAAIGWRDVAPRARRFALWLVVGVHGLSVGAALVLGVACGPVRYVALAVVGLVAVVGAAASRTRLGWVLAALLAGCVGLRIGMTNTDWSDTVGSLRRGEAVALPPSSQIGPGERVVLDHYLAHPR